MISIGDVKNILVSIAQNLPHAPIIMAIAAMEQEIARLNQLRDGSNDGEYDGIIASLMEALDHLSKAAAHCQTSDTVIIGKAGRL